MRVPKKLNKKMRVCEKKRNTGTVVVWLIAATARIANSAPQTYGSARLNADLD